MGYEIVWEEPNGLVKRHFGHVTGKEVLDANCNIEKDSRFDALRYVINDFSECVGVSASITEIEEIAAIDYAAAASNPNIRLAIVATHPDVLVASARYISNPVSPFPARIFDSMDDARSWLGLHAT